MKKVKINIQSSFDVDLPEGYDLENPEDLKSFKESIFMDLFTTAIEQAMNRENAECNSIKNGNFPVEGSDRPIEDLEHINKYNRLMVNLFKLARTEAKISVEKVLEYTNDKMEISIKDLQNILDLYHSLDGFWEDIEIIDKEFIEDCRNFLKEYFEADEISLEEFSENSEYLKVLEKFEGSEFSHSPMKSCKHDYSWVDFETYIIFNKSKYVLWGEFCPADGYVFKGLEKQKK